MVFISASTEGQKIKPKSEFLCSVRRVNEVDGTKCYHSKFYSTHQISLSLSYCFFSYKGGQLFFTLLIHSAFAKNY